MVLKAFPTGRRLAATLMGWFKRMRAQVAVWLRQWFKFGMPDTSPPNLEVWTDGMVSTSTPILLPTFIREGNQQARKISIALPGDTLSPKEIFNSINPRVRQAVDELALDFCQTTNRTAMTDLGTALARLREELKEGLELGEALPKLTKRVASIFGSPRAIDIARTESARAMMAGRFMAAKDSGVVVGKKWLAKSDACKKFCKPLDGKVVGMDEPFDIQPKGGPYAVIMYPPYHPNCTCDWQPVIDPALLGKNKLTFPVNRINI